MNDIVVLAKLPELPEHRQIEQETPGSANVETPIPTIKPTNSYNWQSIVHLQVFPVSMMAQCDDQHIMFVGQHLAGVFLSLNFGTTHDWREHEREDTDTQMLFVRLKHG
jgi:hypothetical protein